MHYHKKRKFKKSSSEIRWGDSLREVSISRDLFAIKKAIAGKKKNKNYIRLFFVT